MIQTSRILYRVNQFLHALPNARAVTTDQVRRHLSPPQIVLFRQMQPSEQAHALSVMQRLQEDGQTHPALLTAALLHDVGKVLYPLSLRERVVIVLAGRFLPRLAERWGEGTPRGLRRPFVVAVRHPEWGADLAARAGASKLAAHLVRRHQETRNENPHSLEDRLLAALQEVDDTH